MPPRKDQPVGRTETLLPRPELKPVPPGRTVLLVAAGKLFADEQRQLLMLHGMQVDICRSIAAAMERLSNRAYDVVFVHWRTLEVEFLGRDWRDAWHRSVQLAKRGDPETVVVVSTEPGAHLMDEVTSVATVAWPGLIPADRILAVAPERSLAARARSWLVGRSAAALRMAELVDLVASRSTPVLITGETGTGKEYTARAIHRLSPRRDRELAIVRCRGTRASELEEELFGAGSRSGRLEQAHESTLLVDAIDELPAELQPALLRAIEQKAVLREGADRSVDVRLLATTEVDLRERVLAGRFLADLFFRIQIFPIELPPLRERVEDIPILAEYLLDVLCRRDGVTRKRLGAGVAEHLMRRPWQGNIRELENAVEHALIRCGSRREVHVSDLPPAPVTRAAGVSAWLPPIPREGIDLKSLVARFEREMIERSLEQTGGNKNRAARLLGMNRTTLVEKLKRFEPAP